MSTALVLGCLVAAGLPSEAAPTRSTTRAELVIERISSQGAASFRLDVQLDPGGSTGFAGAVALGLGPSGRPTQVRPLSMTSLNEHRDPTLYSGSTSVSTCDAAVCETGRTSAGLVVGADDDGPTETPLVIVALSGASIRWTFVGTGYRLRKVPARFAFLTGARAGGSGVNYLGSGAEVYDGQASLAGGPHGSVAVGSAPCSTSGSGLAARGLGRISLIGGATAITEACPLDDGVLASGAAGATRWQLTGAAAGDADFRGARLMVVDLPLR